MICDHPVKINYVCMSAQKIASFLLPLHISFANTTHINHAEIYEELTKPYRIKLSLLEQKNILLGIIYVDLLIFPDLVTYIINYLIIKSLLS